MILRGTRVETGRYMCLGADVLYNDMRDSQGDVVWYFEDVVVKKTGKYPKLQITVECEGVAKFICNTADELENALVELNVGEE